MPEARGCTGGGKRVERALAHTARLRFSEFSVKVVRHRNRASGCGNLWKKLSGSCVSVSDFQSRPQAGGTPHKEGDRPISEMEMLRQRTLMWLR